jgi:hypothetical protein
VAADRVRLAPRHPEETPTMKNLLARSQHLSAHSWVASVLALTAWAIVSFAERSPAVLVFFVVWWASGEFLIRVICGHQADLTVYRVALALRTIVALLAWYISPDAGTVYWTGSNPDSERFYLASSLDLQTALISFDDPGFPFVNWCVAQAGEYLGGSCYLALVQFPLVMGAAFAALVGALVRERTTPETGRVAGYLIAFHPVAIGLSTGLLRDSVVAAAGCVVIVTSAVILNRRGVIQIALLLLLLASSWTVWKLRHLAAIAVGATALPFVATGLFRQYRGTRSGKVIAGLAVVALLVGGGAIAREASKFLDINLQRAENFRIHGGDDDYIVDPGGVSAKMNSNWQWWYPVVLSPYAAFGPFPFYTAATPNIGRGQRMVDILSGLGGLMNQLLAAYFIVGALTLLRKSRVDGLICLCGVLGLGLMNAAAQGQIRYMMAHGYPLMYFAVAVGWIRCRPQKRLALTVWVLWTFTTAGIYGAYWTYKLTLDARLSSILYALPIAVGFGGAVLTAHRLSQPGRHSRNRSRIAGARTRAPYVAPMLRG